MDVPMKLNVAAEDTVAEALNHAKHANHAQTVHHNQVRAEAVVEAVASLVQQVLMEQAKAWDVHHVMLVNSMEILDLQVLTVVKLAQLDNTQILVLHHVQNVELVNSMKILNLQVLPHAKLAQKANTMTLKEHQNAKNVAKAHTTHQKHLQQHRPVKTVKLVNTMTPKHRKVAQIVEQTIMHQSNRKLLTHAKNVQPTLNTQPVLLQL